MATMIELRKINIGSMLVSKLVYNRLQDLICESKKNNKKINMAKAISIMLEDSCQLSKSAQDTQPATVTTDIEITPTQIRPLNDSEEAMDEIFDYKSNGYLTNKEAAKFIGCSEAEICNAHKHGTLKSKRTGRVIRQHVNDLKRWNEERLKKMFME